MGGIRHFLLVSFSAAYSRPGRGGNSLSRESRRSSPQSLPPTPPGGQHDIHKPGERYNLCSMSLVCRGVFSCGVFWQPHRPWPQWGERTTQSPLALPPLWNACWWDWGSLQHIPSKLQTLFRSLSPTLKTVWTGFRFPTLSHQTEGQNFCGAGLELLFYGLTKPPPQPGFSSATTRGADCLASQ